MLWLDTNNVLHYLPAIYYLLHSLKKAYRV